MDGKADSTLALNGVNGSTGEYLGPGTTVEKLSSLIRDEMGDDRHKEELKLRRDREKGEVLALTEGIDPKNLSETGWGVIFADGCDAAIREALKPLLDYRKSQASAKDESYYREFWGPSGYLRGESKIGFLARYGVGSGPANPQKIPYYLLLAGDPTEIPYRFQYQLDVQYAVGRIYFDSPEGYANYARGVIASEKKEPKRRVTFFGVSNDDDRATALSSAELVSPLSDHIAKNCPDWPVASYLAEYATKKQFSEILSAGNVPAFLFSASHGMAFEMDDPRQKRHQGALLCQDWPGPEEWRRKPIPEDFYFSGDDVPKDADLSGLISFHFACFSAGTPDLDDFDGLVSGQFLPLASKALISRLPMSLLSNPGGPALAAIGHVERAWSYSFVWENAGRQIEVFEATLRRLLNGHPIGSAMEYFGQRYAEVSTDLVDCQQQMHRGMVVNDMSLASLWAANNDARNYVILGDPAVRFGVPKA